MWHSLLHRLHNSKILQETEEALLPVALSPMPSPYYTVIPFSAFPHCMAIEKSVLVLLQRKQMYLVKAAHREMCGNELIRKWDRNYVIWMGIICQMRMTNSRRGKVAVPHISRKEGRMWESKKMGRRLKGSKKDFCHQDIALSKPC